MSSNEESKVDANPFRSPASESPPAPSNRRATWRLSVYCALLSVLLTVPLAGACALFFRFPAPFAGYLSGIEAVVPAMFAVMFYGIVFGVYLLVSLFAAAGGSFVSRMGPYRQSMRLVGAAFLPAAIMVVLLVTLDWYIGPW